MFPLLYFTLPVLKDLQKESFWMQRLSLEYSALKGDSFGTV